MIAAAVTAVPALVIATTGSLVSCCAFHHDGVAVGFSGHISSVTRLTEYAVAVTVRDGMTVAGVLLTAAGGGWVIVALPGDQSS